MELTQDNFDKLINVMNHKISDISKGINQVKYIMIGTSVIYTLSVVALLLL